MLWKRIYPNFSNPTRPPNFFPTSYSQQVQKIDIGYAKTAKKIDVKKLKKGMWEILVSSPSENDDANKVRSLKIITQIRYEPFLVSPVQNHEVTPKNKRKLLLDQGPKPKHWTMILWLARSRENTALFVAYRNLQVYCFSLAEVWALDGLLDIRSSPVSTTQHFLW